MSLHVAGYILGQSLIPEHSVLATGAPGDRGRAAQHGLPPQGGQAAGARPCLTLGDGPPPPLRAVPRTQLHSAARVPACYGLITATAHERAACLVPLQLRLPTPALRPAWPRRPTRATTHTRPSCRTQPRTRTPSWAAPRARARRPRPAAAPARRAAWRRRRRPRPPPRSSSRAAPAGSARTGASLSAASCSSTRRGRGRERAPGGVQAAAGQGRQLGPVLLPLCML